MDTHYKKIQTDDFDDDRKLIFNIAELKVIYNTFIDILEEHPEMKTYGSVCNKILKKLDGECCLDNFYGVNEVWDVDLFQSDSREGLETAVQLNMQSTFHPDNEDFVIFFNQEQIEFIYKQEKKLKKSIKKINISK